MKKFNQIFPEEIISDILSRLPAESVLESKLVCTTWKSLIQQPSFPQMHLNHLNSTDSGKLRYVFLAKHRSQVTQLSYFEYNNENEDWNHPVESIHRDFYTGTLYLDNHVLIGSFNGLVCVYGTGKRYNAMIINPLTKQYIVLPVFDTPTNCYPDAAVKGKNPLRYEHLACGFGYLAATNEYKVVRIYKIEIEDGEPNVVEAEVYTVGSGKGWRHVGKFDLGFEFVVDSEYRDGYEQLQGVFWNECVHWRNVKGGMVVVFDLAQEKFGEPIPPPPMLTYDDEDDDEDEGDNMVLGVSNGGILYYTVSQYRPYLDEEEEEAEQVYIDEVWLLMRKDNDDNHVMREQQEKQSWVWSKPVSLEQTEPFAFFFF